MYKLWTHEVLRVFSDRLITEEDKLSLLGMMKHATHEFLGTKLDNLFKDKITGKNITPDDLRLLFFGNYIGKRWEGLFNYTRDGAE